MAGEREVGSDGIAQLGFGAAQMLAAGVLQDRAAVRGRRGDHQVFEIDVEPLDVEIQPAMQKLPFDAGFVVLRGLWLQHGRGEIRAEIDRRGFEGVAVIEVGA